MFFVFIISSVLGCSDPQDLHSVLRRHRHNGTASPQLHPERLHHDHRDHRHDSGAGAVVQVPLLQGTGHALQRPRGGRKSAVLTGFIRVLQQAEVAIHSLVNRE